MGNWIGWLLDWRSLAAGAVTLAGMALRLAGGERVRPWRWLAAHTNREREHARTVTKLWRAEDDLDSLTRQIEVMDQRIEDLLDLSSDVSLRDSRAKIRRSIQRLRTSSGESVKSNAKLTASRRE